MEDLINTLEAFRTGDAPARDVAIEIEDLIAQRVDALERAMEFRINALQFTVKAM